MTTPPMPEPPSMKDRLGRYLPDAVGFAKTVQYITELQEWGCKGWAEAERLEAENKACRARINQDSHDYLELEAENNALRAKAGRLEYFVRRYRKEVPLGYQPSMMAHEVDKALAEWEKK